MDVLNSADCLQTHLDMDSDNFNGDNFEFNNSITDKMLQEYACEFFFFETDSCTNS